MKVANMKPANHCLLRKYFGFIILKLDRNY